MMRRRMGNRAARRDLLEYLYEVRGIKASGDETTDTDRGVATSRGACSLEYCVLSRDRYQSELPANADALPQARAIALVSFPEPRQGSGFPARVFAVAP
jgi:kynurenine formamidase